MTVADYPEFLNQKGPSWFRRSRSTSGFYKGVNLVEKYKD